MRGFEEEVSTLGGSGYSDGDFVVVEVTDEFDCSGEREDGWPEEVLDCASGG